MASELSASEGVEVGRPVAAEPVVPVSLAGLPWGEDLGELLTRAAGADGSTEVWGRAAIDVEARLAGLDANRLERVDERPGVSRIEVHRQSHRWLSKPHLGLEFFEGRLYLLYAFYGKPTASVSAATITQGLIDLFGSAVKSWDEGPRRTCEAYQVRAE